MQKKIRMVLVMMLLLLTSSVVFAASSTDWSPSYNGAYYRYVNIFGGADWDGLQWYNGKSYTMEITYKTKLSNGSIVNRVITLNGGKTSDTSAIVAGERVSSVAVKLL